MLRRKSLWRGKNQRRSSQGKSPAAKERELETRRLNRIEDAISAENELLAEINDSPQINIGKTKPNLKIRLTVEVLSPDGTRDRHQFTTEYQPLFKSWSVPASRIKSGIAALMSCAPEIVELV